MDFNLAGELLTGLCTCQVGLRNNFESPSSRLMLLSLDRLNPAHFIALREATLAEEATSLVSNDLARLIMVFRIHWLNFLFNDL